MWLSLLWAQTERHPLAFCGWIRAEMFQHTLQRRRPFLNVVTRAHTYTHIHNGDCSGKEAGDSWDSCGQKGVNSGRQTAWEFCWVRLKGSFMADRSCQWHTEREDIKERSWLRDSVKITWNLPRICWCIVTKQKKKMEFKCSLLQSYVCVLNCLK